MKRESSVIRAQNIESRILTIRGQKVILDAGLARLYSVETKAFNRAFKRNADRFPADFVFQLTREELGNLRYQSGTSSSGYGGRRYLPYAFTENGAVMSANILNSPEAVRMSVFVVRAFVKMRELLGGTRELAKQLAALEKKLTARLDIHETAIVEVLQRIMNILNPPPPPPDPPDARLGSMPGPMRKCPARPKEGRNEQGAIQKRATSGVSPKTVSCLLAPVPDPCILASLFSHTNPTCPGVIPVKEVASL